ncbi:MAG: DUF349 domain-containing protein, partial [Bacteroidota bacterium]
TEPTAEETTTEDTGEAAEGQAATAEGEAEAAEGEETLDDVTQAFDLLADILGDEANFESVVEKSNPQELVMLMERIAQDGDIGQFISKVGLVKRSFGKKTDDESVETALQSRFNTALNQFNRKRSAYYAEREKEKEENSQKKFALLERLKVIVSEEQVTKIQDVRQIQSEWREIGWVLQKDMQSLNETYKQYLDLFYGLRSKYRELLELDRRYNMDEKKKLIGEVEGLIPEEEGLSREDWNKRSQRVKDIQEMWRSVGHVPRENVEEINGSWRDTLDRFYEMRSSYYELQDQKRGENAEAKRGLLEKLAAYSSFESNKARAWNEATKAVLAVQEEWKKIGPGPLAENKQLWKDYRTACDNFFSRKGAYFKEFDKQRAAHLQKKIEICEKAEALQDSEDWKETARILKELQREWKQIGPVHERHSNKVWKRFRKACDHFFERRSASMSSDRKGYQENLKTKEQLIERVRAINEEENPAHFAEEFVEIQAQWKQTGHVPFKVKDKINNAFKEALSEFYRRSRLSRNELSRVKSTASLGNIKNEDERTRRIKDEMRKIRGRMRGLQEKVDQYEINIQYISKGKSGKSLREQIQRQIDNEKAAIESLRKQRKELQHLLDNPPQPEPEKPTAPEAPAVEAGAPTAEPESETPAPEAPAAEAEAPTAEPEPEAPAPEAPAAESEAPTAEPEPEAPAVEAEAPTAEPEPEAPAPEAPTAEAEAPTAEPEPETPAPDVPAAEADAPAAEPEAEAPAPEVETSTAETEADAPASDGLADTPQEDEAEG